MNFIGSGKRINDWDIPRIGHTIGVGEDEIHAFMEVEAGSSGFDRQNRLKMLFEPLWFYRHLTPDGLKGRPKPNTPAGNAMLVNRARAVSLGLASPTRPMSYPPESYTRLHAAMAIDETAALLSASWGLGQIMGFNHRVVGYSTVQAMIAAFCADEANQLQAIVDYLIANKLDDDLRAHNWRSLARGYNGEGYERDGYHIKLANAYAKWSRIPDTPWKPGQVTPTHRPVIVSRETMATGGVTSGGATMGTGKPVGAPVDTMATGPVANKPAAAPSNVGPPVRDGGGFWSNIFGSIAGAFKSKA
jgi:hypothetical protein